MLSSTSVYAQSERVTLTFREMPLNEILTELGHRYGLNFSYSNDLPGLDQQITIKANDQPIHEFLKELFDRAGLEYKMINRHVALNRKASRAKSPLQKSAGILKKNETQAHREMTTPQQFSAGETPGTKTDDDKIPAGLDGTDQTPVVPDYATLSQRQTIEMDMERPGSQDEGDQITFESTTESGSIAWHSIRKPDLGIVASLDFYDFQAASAEGQESSYSVKPNYSAGFYVRYDAIDRLSFDLQLRLATRNFQVHYNYRATDPQDPFLVDRTSFRLSYLSVPLRANYLLLAKERLHISASLGAVVDIRIASKSHTFLRNGDESVDPALLGKIHSHSFGGVAGIQAEYTVSDRISVNLSPAYRYYFTPVNEGAMRINTRMMAVAFGVLFSLQTD